jgi:hypothetical protein
MGGSSKKFMWWHNSNGWWVGHLGIHEELSYGQCIMEHVTTEGSKCLRDVGRIAFINL